VNNKKAKKFRSFFSPPPHNFFAIKLVVKVDCEGVELPHIFIRIKEGYIKYKNASLLPPVYYKLSKAHPKMF